jgi:hypothetical protein
MSGKTSIGAISGYDFDQKKHASTLNSIKNAAKARPLPIWPHASHRGGSLKS